MQDPTTPPAASIPTPAAPPTIAPGPPQMEITASQAETVASWIRDDLAKGKMTPEQAAKAFEELNTPMEQRAPDTRSDEAKQLDAAFPVARPKDYRIPYADSGQDPPPMTPELKQFDSAARTWMSGAGLPRE